MSTNDQAFIFSPPPFLRLVTCGNYNQIDKKIQIKFDRIARKKGAAAAEKTIKTIFIDLFLGAEPIRYTAYSNASDQQTLESQVIKNFDFFDKKNTIRADAGEKEVEKWARKNSLINHKLLTDHQHALASTGKNFTHEENDYIFKMLTINTNNQGLTLHQPIPKKIARTEKSRKQVAAIAKMCSYSKWLATTRRILRRKYEGFRIRMGEVAAARSLYSSDYAVKAIRLRDEKNQQILEAIKVINEVGEVFTLRELSQKGDANPEVRAAKLIVHAKGLDKSAKKYSWIGHFMTATIPTQFHRMIKSRSSRSIKTSYGNKKYNLKNLPNIGQDFLNSKWSRVRARLAKNNIQILGLRVAEPTHSATPHWHITAFFNKKQSDEGYKIVREVFQDHVNESKHTKEEAETLKKAAFYSEIIDSKMGCASYILKYISKNIGGTFSKDDEKKCEALDFEASNCGINTRLIDNVERVTTWARVWGIRQFQFFGGASVGLWDDLRKIKRLDVKRLPPNEKKLIIKMWSHARNNRWHKYNEELGYTLSEEPPTADQELKRKISKSFEIKEDLNEFYEEVPVKIGLLVPVVKDCEKVGYIFIKTKHHTWTIIQKKPEYIAPDYGAREVGRSLAALDLYE